MFNLDELVKRFEAWSHQFEIDFPTRPPVPILIYQSIFTLIHNLKSSFHITEDRKIKDLEPVLISIDHGIHPLAFDQSEFEDEINDELYYHIVGKRESRANKTFPTLHSVYHFLDKHIHDAIPIKHDEIPIFKQPYPWDDFSKARAYSAARHLFKFHSKHKNMQLKELIGYDISLKREVASFFGVHIIRKVTSAQGTPSIEVAIDDLFAFFQDPPNNSWRPIK